jgi:glyoxylase-like metal-dependent hydrolase (beta-lactamase superfamily II)
MDGQEVPPMTDPAPHAWRIGAVTVIEAVEQETVVAASLLLPKASGQEVRAIPWLTPAQADGEGRLILSFRTLVIRTPTCVVVVDTCIGDDREGLDTPRFNGLKTGYLETLARGGVAPDEVDVVLCTHLHFDHVGWNTRRVDGAWRPTFPNARYLIDRTEYEHWRAHADEGEVQAILRQSLDPIEAAGLLELIDARRGYGICDEVKLAPTPGHTPGHVSVRITSEGESAIITGDVVHHPCQMARPEWGSVSDWDADQAQRTRRELLSGCEAHGTLIIGSHFAGDPAGRVRRDGAAWRLIQG